KNDIFSEIERHAAALGKALRKADATDGLPFLLVSLGATCQDANLRDKIWELGTRPYFRILMANVDLLQQVASVVLGARRMKKGAARRTDQALLCSHLVEALSTTAGWAPGDYDATVVGRIGRALFPYLSKFERTIAPASEKAFVTQLCKTFRTS